MDNESSTVFQLGCFTRVLSPTILIQHLTAMSYILSTRIVLQSGHLLREESDSFDHLYLRNKSAPAVNCWVIIHCLEVSCKEDQITSAQWEWFIFVQLTDKQWIITQQFLQWSWSISILTHNKRRKHIRSLQPFQLSTIALKNSRQYLDYVTYVYT